MLCCLLLKDPKSGLSFLTMHVVPCTSYNNDLLNYVALQCSSDLYQLPNTSNMKPTCSFNKQEVDMQILPMEKLLLFFLVCVSRILTSSVLK